MKRCNRAVFLSNLNLLVCDLLEDLTIEFFNSNYLDVLFYILCKLKKRNVCLLNLLSLRNFSKSVKPNLEETYESMLKTIGPQILTIAMQSPKQKEQLSEIKHFSRR